MREDPGYFEEWPYPQRPAIRWPGGARLALWVAPNVEYYEFDPPPNPKRAPWPQPTPAVPGFSIRDYGNRVGHRRQMDLLDKYGVRGSVSLSVAMCDHHPEIIRQCVDRGWEIFSHGIYNTRYTYGLTEAQERAMIRDAMVSIHRHTGQRCAGYLAPALSHSEHTLDLFAEVGTELFGDEGGFYTCDLFHDDQPTPIRLRSGKRFVSVPYSLEMNDTIVFAVNKVEPRRYLEMLKRCFDRLYAEGVTSGTVMCIPTHSYQIGCPHRIRVLEEALEYMTGHSEVWVTTGREIASHYLQHHYDIACADIAAGVARQAAGQGRDGGQG